jgi:hypothetical protein
MPARQQAAGSLVAAARRAVPEERRVVYDHFEKLVGQLIELSKWQPSGSRRDQRTTSARWGPCPIQKGAFELQRLAWRGRLECVSCLAHVMVPFRRPVPASHAAYRWVARPCLSVGTAAHALAIPNRHHQPPAPPNNAHRSSFRGLVNLLPVEVMVPTQEAMGGSGAVLPPSATGGSVRGYAGAGGLPSGQFPTVSGIRDEVVVMPSLQKPKKIVLVGSDGREYPFLAKPKDDLRKDYRLMDFVGVLNDLLGREIASRRRGLRLRTYAVLPLTEDCGILQWVNGLVPFKGACEEVYSAAGLYKRQQTPGQIKKMYDAFAGARYTISQGLDAGTAIAVSC